MTEKGGLSLWSRIREYLPQRSLFKKRERELPQTDKILFLSGRTAMTASPEKLTELLGFDVGENDIIQMSPSCHPLDDPLDHFLRLIRKVIEEERGRPRAIVVPKDNIKVHDMAFFEGRQTNVPVPPQRTVEDVIGLLSQASKELEAVFRYEGVVEDEMMVKEE